MKNEKQVVALSSVIAAVFLTTVKIVVGVITGSLGILSEAAHSTLDLFAAIVTLFAVKLSDKPADEDHNYGHGKIESFSALIETLLLLATCGWIIYEAVERLFFGKSIAITGTYWGIGVMILAIAIDSSRSRALKKTAQKYGSQALEADALHFSSDVWSSSVVIGGLAMVQIGKWTNLPFFEYADPIAALGVSILVIVVSVKLGKRTIDVLLDTAPKGMINNIIHEANGVNGVLEVAGVRVRPSGPDFFIDLDIGLNRNESHRVIHSIVNEVRERIKRKFPNSDIVISTFPIDISASRDREVYLTVKKVVDGFPNCTNIHNIHVYEVNNEKFIAIHLEVKEKMCVKESHELSHEISGLVQQKLPDVRDVSVNFEYVNPQYIVADDITDQSEGLLHQIDALINQDPEQVSCHDVRIYRRENKLTLFLHCEMNEDYPSDTIENISKELITKLRNQIDNIENIHLHVEPINN
ncbi:MAG TPA: cation diffusion facilitator family transporter [Bacillota bacterium]|nr:cation diffusion facilitator family transporter [Bacillota bacterium]